jgi:hypothetical protein
MRDYKSSAQHHLQEASMYDSLAQYYKYLDPSKHIHYYQMHLAAIQKALENDRAYKKSALVRVFHASPDAPAVDIYVDNKAALGGVTFKKVSKYLQLQAGRHKIEIYPEGETKSPIISKTITVKPGVYYTAAAKGAVDQLDLLVVVDEPAAPARRTKVRFLHLSPDAPAVDIVLQNGQTLFKDISFGEVTPYLELAPSMVNLEVRVSETGQTVLMIPNIKLSANRSYTVAAIGFAGKEPRLEAMVLKG